MILHYLGLDHVGHIEGPFAPVNIKRKLHEMDQVISKIYSSLNGNDLFCIVSDHGMANEGGHGGSSKMETITPLVFISKGDIFKDYDLRDGFNKLIKDISVYEQVDMVTIFKITRLIIILKYSSICKGFNSKLSFKLTSAKTQQRSLFH